MISQGLKSWRGAGPRSLVKNALFDGSRSLSGWQGVAKKVNANGATARSVSALEPAGGLVGGIGRRRGAGSVVNSSFRRRLDGRMMFSTRTGSDAMVMREGGLNEEEETLNNIAAALKMLEMINLVSVQNQENKNKSISDSTQKDQNNQVYSDVKVFLDTENDQENSDKNNTNNNNQDITTIIFEAPKRQYQPKYIKRKRRHGFLRKLRTTAGRKQLARKMRKGRKRLAAQ